MPVITTSAKRTAYDEEMDAIASRIGKAVDGVPFERVILACSAVIGFSILALGKDREEALHTVNRMINHVFNTGRVVRPEETH